MVSDYTEIHGGLRLRRMLYGKSCHMGLRTFGPVAPRNDAKTPYRGTLPSDDIWVRKRHSMCPA